MEGHIQIELQSADELQREILIAGLSGIGFEGFEESGDQLKAFIPKDLFDQASLDALLENIDYKQSEIEKQNWNQLWESNFEPVQVEDFVGIRASFHPHITGVQHEIVITPKMSFGTGHHATTWLVMQAMRNLDFQQKSVFDFGTGTGILAILAEQLGASEVLAVDNDDWCIENASENVQINQCKNVVVAKAENARMANQYDIILANINKHIILENIPYLVHSLRQRGTILLSGLLQEDESDILQACLAAGWKHQFTRSRNGWILCQFLG